MVNVPVLRDRDGSRQGAFTIGGMGTGTWLDFYRDALLELGELAHECGPTALFVIVILAFFYLFVRD